MRQGASARSGCGSLGILAGRGLPIVRDPVLPDKADYLVMESTYGDTVHPNPEEATGS